MENQPSCVKKCIVLKETACFSETIIITLWICHLLTYSKIIRFCVFIVIPMPTKLLSCDLLGFADDVDEVSTISERIEGKTFLCEFKCHVKCSASQIW